MGKAVKISLVVAAVTLALIAFVVVAAHVCAEVPTFVTVALSVAIAIAGVVADIAIIRDELAEDEDEHLFLVRDEDGRAYLVPASRIYLNVTN